MTNKKKTMTPLQINQVKLNEDVKITSVPFVLVQVQLLHL